jgi:hypothetical protein
MKKILFGLLIVALLVCITSCSEDQYAKLGDLMGKMSGNVYGIQPNMKDVDAATEKVDDTVKTEGDTVTVEIKSEDAKNIVDSVLAVQDSSSKTEALQESLSEPLLKEATDAQKQQLQSQIEGQAESSKIATATVESYSGEQKELAEAVNKALDAVKGSISENPTKGELATVAVLKTLSDAVKEGEGYADAGKAAVDALKITTEVGKVDVFANADISALIGKISGKGISRDGEDSGIKDYLPILSKSAADIIKCFTTADGKFDSRRYGKFILESRTIKTAYEMIAKSYKINFNIKLEDQKIEGKGLTIEELGRYLVATIFSELDRISKEGEAVWKGKKSDAPENTFRSFLNSYVTANYDKLMDLADNYDKLDDPTAEGSASYTPLVNLAKALAYGVGVDPDEAYDYDKLVETLKNSLKDSGKLNPVAINIFTMVGVVLLDSEYTSLLSLGEMDGKLSTLLNKITD